MKVVIIGSGNIGMDLMYKVFKSPVLKMGLLTGLNSDSERLIKAKQLGVPTSDKGIEALIEDPQAGDIVFDATTAKAHLKHAPILKKLGKVVIDMTPAGIGTWVVPAFNLEENLNSDNINLISCGGQAVIPLVTAVSRIVDVEYAEAVNASASRGVGPGTRANVDEYTEITGKGMVKLGKAKTAKAIIVINPAEPPIKMHNTVFCVVKELNEENAPKIEKSIRDVIQKIKSYVPGYEMTTSPQFNFERKLVTVMVEIEGAGDYLPKYAGNLDIITQAGIAVAERFAKEAAAKEGRR
ncbi:MAG: acetaldehyde dehydrogenase (acetylating) [Planctomycetota bacterium]